MARCVAHPDRSASLSITDMGQGKTRLHCFAGCAQADVLRSAGMTWKDLRLGDASPEIRQRMALEDKLQRLERRKRLMQWMEVIEPERRRYWQAAIRRVIAEIEPLYWEVMPDKEKIDRLMQFEIDDYRKKRLDWQEARRRNGVHDAGVGVQHDAK